MTDDTRITAPGGFVPPSFNIHERLDSLPPLPPQTRWDRLRARRDWLRERVALWLAPWLDPYDDLR